MLVIGVTGSYGTGKTTVSGMFVELGAELVDADDIAHEVISYGTEGYNKVLSKFGRDMLDDKGCIDRSKLAEIVFCDKSRLQELCRIIHPPVVYKIKERLSIFEKEGMKQVVVLDVPLLIEVGMDNMVDYIVVVNASLDVQIRRSSLREDETLMRIACQMGLNDKEKRADFVVDNNGDIEETRRQVEDIWRKIAV